MKTIIALLRKDLAVMRKYWIYSVIMVVNLLLMPLVLNRAPASGMVSAMFFIVFAAMPLQLEERGKGLSLIASLPVKRSAVPAAQYLVLAAFFVFSAALFAAMAIVLRAIPDSAGVARRTLVPGAIILCFPFLALSVFFPLWYRFGYMKTRAIMMVLIIGLTFSSFFFNGFGAFGKPAANPNAVLALFEGLPALPVLIACPLAVLAALGISCIVSMRIYEKKEF
jgi:ABC-2 type transport system permease protein